MRSFQKPLFPAMTLPGFSRHLALVQAFVLTAGFGACSTTELHPDVVLVSPLSDTSGPAHGLGTVMIYAVRDDAISQDAPPVTRDLPPYHVMVDGRLAAWGDGDYATIFVNTQMSFQVAAGSHTVSLADDAGAVAVTTPPFDVRTGSTASVVVYGSATTLRTRTFLDDPSAITAGSLRLRLVNALDDHQPVELVRCSGTVYDAAGPGTCTAAAAPVSYGDVAELDVAPTETPFLGWRWAGAGGTGAVVQAMIRPEGGVAGAFYTRIPIHVLGPASTCPSCVYTEF